MFADRVMGIDPGVSTTGFGVVERAANGIRAVEFGAIRTDPGLPLHERLAILSSDLEELMARHQPGSVAVERVLFQNNARTAMSVGQASGVALVAAARAGAEVGVYSPNEVKLAVVGYGSATKAQVTEMVARILGLAALPRPADAADALAIAISHINSARLRSRLEKAAG